MREHVEQRFAFEGVRRGFMPVECVRADYALYAMTTWRAGLVSSAT
jgi:hypothetical protein